MDVAKPPHIFSSCITTLDCLHVSAGVGADRAECILRLELLKLRMSRWAKSRGVKDLSVAGASEADAEADISLADNVLVSMMETLEKAVTDLPSCEALPRAENDAEVDEVLWLKDALRKRHGYDLEKTEKASANVFVIQSKAQFDDLVKRLSELVDVLEYLDDGTNIAAGYCSPSKVGGALCTTNIRQALTDEAEASVTHPRAKSLEICPQGNMYTNVEVSGNSRLHAGDNIAYGLQGHGHTYSHMKTSGNALGHFGNYYRDSE